MKIRLLATVVALAGMIAVVPAAAQTPAGATKAPAAKAATTPWTPPKTPWGHPDISGTWTSDGAIGIPRERPTSSRAEWN